jgi:hypothetical protein
MLTKLRKAREAYELGKTMQRAVERGRKLHPWRGRRFAMDALISEVDELRVEVVKRDECKIRAEAIDVAVVALRIAAGR